MKHESEETELALAVRTAERIIKNYPQCEPDCDELLALANQFILIGELYARSVQERMRGEAP